MTLKINKYLLLFGLVIGSQVKLFAQESISKKVYWSSNPAEMPLLRNGKPPVAFFKDALFGKEFDSLPFFGGSLAVNSFSTKIQLIPGAIEEIFLPSAFTSNLPADFSFSYIITTERKLPLANFTLCPLRKNSSTGKIERLMDYQLQFSSNNAYRQAAIGSRTYAANSVLATGNWHKVGVTNDGVYKISASLLKSIGIDPSVTDPRSIRIYGRTGGMLPQANSTPRIDDLAELSIMVQGESDGVFNVDDYILFYAKGPHQWMYNKETQLFNRTQHPYCDTTYYFITADLGNGKRIASQASLNSSPSNTVKSYASYDIHKTERQNKIRSTIKSGREWYGEDFEFSPSYDFNFRVVNIDQTSPISVTTAVVGRSETANSVGISVNNTPLYTVPFGSLIFSQNEDYFARQGIRTGKTTVNSDDFKITAGHSISSADANAWLNYILINAARKPLFSGDQLAFCDPNTAGSGNITQFLLGNTNSTIIVWDITNPLYPVKQLGQQTGTDFSFIAKHDSLNQYIAFNPTATLQTPSPFGKVANQNLHALSNYDMIIITPGQFTFEAKRLADFKKSNTGLDAVVVTPQQIYNEFSAGSRDVTAIREFAKMLYDKDGSTPRLKYLLLLGDGSHDNKNILKKGNNLIPTYQSYESLHPINSYVSDDYLGLLDDQEGVYSESASFEDAYDISVGRIPVQNSEQAAAVVDKIIHYSQPVTMQDWRTQITFVADDGNQNLHLRGAEENAAVILNETKAFNFNKIYIDAYKQESTAGGFRYPEVNTAIVQKLLLGTLILNYTGHGGELGWAHERILTIGDINSMQNYDKLPLMITATCGFSRWDDPDYISAGEQILFNPKGGAINLFSTTRTVYSSYNSDLNKLLYRILFGPTFKTKAATMGELFRLSKNGISNGISSQVNARNFSLLGDPSITLAIPRLSIITNSINGKTVISQDTLKALSKVTITGEVRDANNTKLSNYNGIIYPTIYDKIATIRTLGNDDKEGISGEDSASPIDFKLQKNILYKGKVSVQNGSFSFSFITPKDINYQMGYGRISYYAQDGLQDGKGFSDSIIIGGISNAAITDNQGPDIAVYLNDEKFVNGNLTNTNPQLLVKLKDENGINTVGNGIGHDIVGILSKAGQSDQTIVLNDFYQGKIDDYQQGEIKYPLAKLSSGNYKLKVRAWDVYNNASEKTIDFKVSESSSLVLEHVLNYPNPFTTYTGFQFDHNQASGEPLDVNIRIYTLSGKLIKTINTTATSPGNRVEHIAWDGRDDFGDRLGRGVYVYQLRVRTKSGISAEKFEKLVILN